MPSTVDRPQTASVVAQASEYPTDRNQRDREEHKRNSFKSAAPRPEESDNDTTSPAVVILGGHSGSHLPDGVTAYRATAQKVLEPGFRSGERHPLFPDPGRPTAETVRHAYEDHGDPDIDHSVNLAT
ncbi:MAG: hypothetical protein JJ902_17940 [Roseibium sp.]|nr:hypothetical protein [Roseibium sp.]